MGLEADYSHPSKSEAKNGGVIYLLDGIVLN
jgi:hypothetical protein